MTIGTALIVIAILYLLDKHHLLKKALVPPLAALLLTLSALGQAPSLERTQQWISNTLRPQKMVNQPEDNGYSYYSIDNGYTSYIESIESVTFKGCREQIV